MLRLIVLYTALALSANIAAAADLAPLRMGEMKKLAVFSAPLAAPTLPFTDEAGNSRSLADYRGKVVLLNLWATWCAPCRKEMPDIEALAASENGADFVVLTVAASGRDTPQKVASFFERAGVTHLPRFIDATERLARAFGLVGLPATILIDRRGQVVAQLMGPADWSSPEAKAVIAALRAN
ncbi:TlpA family protein disulfide reductase [Rhodobacter maris]|uniref:Thiol-disulfide isomerase/thioredoxin n=1 Tax=Rhodobacter maris TaxID=446682 RepID=A0A285RK36_9RHOB|nr:TlpA disulfide reductase family protein [Rhodobacter maris]SOB94506.1 thiol-disulfide isomerase/thioredoxin [Rhodobacter maris]